MDESLDTTGSFAQLSADDARALDALLGLDEPGQGEGPSDQVTPPAQPERTKRVAKLMSLVAQWPAEDPPSQLLSRTLQRTSRSSAGSLMVDRRQIGHGMALPARWGELIAIAAIIVVAASLAMPVLVQARADARRFACQANLQAAGMALGQYAADFDNLMPRGRISPNSRWWNVGRDRTPDGPLESNSAHLYILVRARYIHPNRLASPGNEHAPRFMSPDRVDWPSPQAVSYSYQNQYTARPIRLDQAPQMAVLANKNPLFDIRPGVSIRLRKIPKTSASLAHRGRGQNILKADGSVIWSRKPVLPNSDNIWLISGLDSYSGTEAPSSPWDSFLVP